MTTIYNYKTTFCGKKEIEETYIKDGQARGYNEKKGLVKKERLSTPMTDEDRARSLRRTKRNIRLLVKTNMSNKALFVTLTYRKNEKDYNQTAKDFRYFNQHIKRQGFYYPYIACREHQSKRGQRNDDEGALHFHIVYFGTSSIPYKGVLDYWQNKGFGNVDFKSLKGTSSTKQVVYYVTKYATKDIGKVRENKRRFLYNKLIKKPDVRYTQIAFDKPYYNVYYDKTVLSTTDNKIIRTRFYKKQ